MGNDLILSSQTFIHLAKQRLEPILNESGTILYSSCETLKPGKYYFLGLNPGGSNDDTKTIVRSLNDLELGISTGNAYLDEDWSGFRRYCVGGHPLQQNYQQLFEKLGEKLDSVCASNLIFSRSISEKGAGGRERAELCWPVHEAVLGRIDIYTLQSGF